MNRHKFIHARGGPKRILPVSGDHGHRGYEILIKATEKNNRRGKTIERSRKKKKK